MNQLNQLVPGLVAKHAAQPQDGVQEYAIGTSSEFIQLKSLCKANWSAILDEFTAIASGDEGKLVVLWAFEGLTAANYMTSVERIAEKYKQNQTTKKVLTSILRPNGRMQAFLADNYQHARVQTLLNDLKTQLAADTEEVSYITDLLSGKIKMETDDFRYAYRETSEGNIPKIILQP